MGISLKNTYRILLPGVILQSVLIGGGFATGREIVEYGAKFGASGWISGLVITIGFMIISTVCFEFSRYWKTYDYRSLTKKLIGPAWFIFEWTYIPLSILIVAVMASAAGEILLETLDLPRWVGIGTVVLVVSILLQMGDEVISLMKSIGTLALIAAYTLFGIIVFSQHHQQVTEVLSTGQGSGSLWIVAWTGVLYIGYNLGIYPASLYTIKGLHSLRESIIAGAVSGVIMAIPWFLTYIAILGFYPDPDIMDAPVPWLRMLQHQSPWVIGIFGIVIGWTLIETATGVIHAFIHRVMNYRKETGRSVKSWHHSLIAVLMLGSSIALSRVGIIDLVAKGYTTMAYVMIVVFVIPLLIRGTRLLFK